MKDNKKFIFLLLTVFLISLFLAILLNTLTYQREVGIITINNSKIEDIKFGFQTIKLFQGFFNSIPRGDLRVYYGLRDNNLNEIFLVGDYQNVGNGSIIMTNLNFPLNNNTWEARFELKDKNLNVLDKKCSLIKFELNNGIRYVSQQNCSF